MRYTLLDGTHSKLGVTILQDDAGQHPDINSAFARAQELAGWPIAPRLVEKAGVRFGTIPGELPRA